MLNQQKGPDWEILAREDSTREVMEIPRWGVEIFRLEQSRGTRNMIEIFC
jgi:hypothetical protein